jgi:hypothetical protein
VYLLGVIIAEGEIQGSYPFWEDSPGEEVKMFDAFLDLLEGREDFALFHYGSYEEKSAEADGRGGRGLPPTVLGKKKKPSLHDGVSGVWRTVRGMDVVKKIQAAPAHGQKLTPPSKIEKVRRKASK